MRAGPPGEETPADGCLWQRRKHWQKNEEESRMAEKQKILIVDDDASISELISL